MNRLLVWGGREGLESHRWVHRAFYENAGKLGIPAVWVKDEPRSRDAIRAGDTVLSADIFGKHLPYVPEVDYVLHNFSGDSPLCQALEETPRNLLRLQVYTSDAAGECWGPCRYYDREARTLFQIWGSDILREEFHAPVFNADSREVPFIGAIWADQHEGIELGNEEMIKELKRASATRGLTFVHRTQVSDVENLRLVRAGRLAPAFAGAWQVAHDYFPCRVAKAAAYGQLPLTNVPACLDVLGDAALHGSVEEVVDQALGLRQSQYMNLVREAQRGMAEMTYRESLQSISRAFDEMRG